VTLSIPGNVFGSHVNDAPLVNIAGRDESGADEFSQPSGGVFVVFIVVVHKGTMSAAFSRFMCSRGPVARRSGHAAA
jgi:hypothetical protein